MNPRPRNVIFRVLMLLVIGAIINVAVAWGFTTLAFSPHLPDWEPTMSDPFGPPKTALMNSQGVFTWRRTGVSNWLRLEKCREPVSEVGASMLDPVIRYQSTWMIESG